MARRKFGGGYMKIKPAKYRNKKCVVDGIMFDSQREAREWRNLKLLERAGKIERLERQPTYKLIVDGSSIGRFTPDFQFFDLDQNRFRVIDVKSPATASETAFRLRKKLFTAIYKIECEVVT